MCGYIYFFLDGTIVVFFLIVVTECGPPVIPACWDASSQKFRGHLARIWG